LGRKYSKVLEFTGILTGDGECGFLERTDFERVPVPQPKDYLYPTEKELKAWIDATRHNDKAEIDWNDLFPSEIDMSDEKPRKIKIIVEVEE